MALRNCIGVAFRQAPSSTQTTALDCELSTVDSSVIFGLRLIAALDLLFTGL